MSEDIGYHLSVSEYISVYLFVYIVFLFKKYSSAKSKIFIC